MSADPAPLSKTAKYKKITKPLLERKRRARINRCLDELKDLMVGALEIDDDNLSKLEKADILELTVNHLTKLHSPKDPVIEAKKFQAGFGQCAAEACRFIMSVPDLEPKVSQSLISHLSRLITAQPLTIQVPDRPHFSPPTSPSSIVSDRQHYYSDPERSSSDAEDSVYSGDSTSKQWAYSRSQPSGPRSNPPLSGLLTTVDKIPQHHSEQVSGVPRNGTYFNRVPAEAKDVILQKIRQHIMDKRGNDGVDANMTADPAEPKYLHREEPYRGEYVHQYPPPSVPSSNATLDLRKVRSPIKSTPEVSPKKTVAYYNANQLDATPSDNKVEAPVSLPEQCESPMDYSNLPPKKKRKLIEYQEYKKQEEARRQLDAFYAEKKGERPPADLEDKWRPW
ncbi:transcription factor HES-4-B-like [Pectinophora gossypiella]|uniref:transcription factor HES-4-B-like n=1 Tax=Pectinophora gossypiella TaxID=13191 RepID=UPI00214DFE18|nr:transcription factor HES-4-B-like [Pectinophora gossypiella]